MSRNGEGKGVNYTLSSIILPWEEYIEIFLLLS